MTDVWDCLSLCLVGLLAVAVLWLVVGYLKLPKCPWCRRRWCVEEDWDGDDMSLRCERCNAHWTE